MASVIQVIISLLALTSVYLAGRKNIHAWTTVVAAHCFAGPYFVVTHQYFLLIWSIGMISFAIRNIILWTSTKEKVS